MTEAALGVIYNDTRDSVLLVKRRDVPIWVLPGGGIDLGESAEEAVVREVFEESGLQVECQRPLGRFLPINRFTNTVYLFECVVCGGELACGDESSDVRYFPLNALPRALFQYHREWLFQVRHQPKQLVCEPMSWRTFLSILFYYWLRPHWGIRYLMTRWRVPAHRGL